MYVSEGAMLIHNCIMKCMLDFFFLLRGSALLTLQSRLSFIIYSWSQELKMTLTLECANQVKKFG